MEGSNERIKEIDILKGIGIVLMIWDHCFGWGKDVFIHSVIQSFHMPLFFIVSGYLWKKPEMKNYIFHKTRTILIPHLNFAIIYSMVFIGLFALGKYTGGGTAKSILALFAFSTRFDLTMFASPIWFLQALFLTNVVFTFLNERFEKCYAYIIIAMAVIGIIYSETCEFMLPFALEPFSTGILFFYIGHRLRNRDWIRVKKIWLLIPLIFIWLLMVYSNGCVDMRSARYYNPVLYIANAMLGTIIFWNISCLIRSWRISDVLRHFSVYSITYLCVHYFFVYYGMRGLECILSLSRTMRGIILFLGVSAVCWILNKLIMKYIPWLVGKKPLIMTQ